jgi:imidazolonepropionase-like amidohydrolase
MMCLSLSLNQRIGEGLRAALLGLVLFAVSAKRASGQNAPLFIQHVAVVDVVDGRVLPDMTVEIRGRTISAMDSAPRIRVTRGARIVDGHGKYLIPGLWDMHVHLSFPVGAAQIFLPLMVANGVLGARDMHSFLPLILSLKRAVAAGTQIGPRLFVAGTAVDGPNSYLPAARIVRTPDEAKAAVRELKAAGVDFIKVYSSLPKDLYLAVAGEAKSDGIPFVGHVPYQVTAAEASDAGQKSLEHLTEVDVGTSSDETAIKAEELEAMNEKHGYIPDPARLKSTFDSVKTTALFERFRRNGTWQVPTLSVFYQERQLAEPGLSGNDSLLIYIPKMLRDYWRSLPVDIATKMVALGAVHSDLVGRLNRAGVQMLAGTDCPNPFVYPGFSLHDELGLLVRSGLTPAEALRTATVNPAIFLGVTDSLGTVARGKVADLVLLEANPLVDIANSKRISAVIQGGRLLDRRALDQMLANARSRAAASGN